jgi:hypothetical protein
VAEIKVGQKWRHKKRDAVYIVVSTTASIQCSTYEDNPIIAALEDEDWVAYQPVKAPIPENLYFRLREEFLDGRFELVEDVQP